MTLPFHLNSYTLQYISLLDKMSIMTLAETDFLKDNLDYKQEMEPEEKHKVKSCEKFRLNMTHIEEMPYANENVVSIYVFNHVYSGGAHGMLPPFLLHMTGIVGIL